MANRKDDLLLHFKFNDLNTIENTVDNSANLASKGKVSGADLVVDDYFGACLSFDGKDDFVQIADSGLTDANPAHTLETWVNLNAPSQGSRSCILVLGQYGRGANHWLLKPKSKEMGELQIGSWLMSGQITTDILLQEWTHLATTYQNGKITLYVNGLSIGETNSTFDIIEKMLTLAAKLSAIEENLHGKMAHLRLYRRALSAEEIKADMLADKMALPAYREAHPIAFSLYDENENYALYIDDDPKDKYPLILELRNTSARAIRFPNLGTEALDNNHHFRLVFRAGTLSQKTLAKLVETNTPQGKKTILGDNDDWDIYSVGEDKLNGTTSLYFLLKNAVKPFLPTQQFKLALHAITAQSGIGARGTRVELRLKDLTYIDDTDNVKITGSRVQHLQIVNHLGSRKIPLHVGFIGSNRILNDASPCDLTLQLMNVLRSESFDTKVTLSPKTEFLITFDVEATTTTKEVAPWSLCTETEIDNINIFVAKTHIHNVPVTRDGKIVNRKITNVPMNEDGEPAEDTVFWQVKKEDHEQGESPVWRLSPKKDLILNRDDYIQIYINNIITSLPSGFTNLYLAYKNIPGFWDGQIVCAIEKAPLLYRKDQPKYNKTPLPNDYLIATPKNVLDIRGSVAIGRNHVETQPTSNKIHLLVNGSVGIGREESDALLYPANGVLRIWGRLKVDDELNIQGERLTFPSMDKRGWYYIERRHNPNRYNHPEDVPSGLGFQIADGGFANIFLKSERNKANTANDQFITFSTKEGADKTNGDNYERMRIAPNGNVGIGTTAPGAKLSVMGGVSIGETEDPDENILSVKGNTKLKGFLSVDAVIDGQILLGRSGVTAGHGLSFGHPVSRATIELPPNNPNELLFSFNDGNGKVSQCMKLSNNNPLLTVLGSISEQMEIITEVTTSDNWDKDSNHPIQQYFKTKLTNQKPGTLIRVLTDFDQWSRHYWEGWVTAKGQICIMHHPQVQSDAIILGAGIVVHAGR